VGESICEGDSGGPAIDEETRAVVGLVSRGGNNTPPDANDPAKTCEDSTGHKAQNVYTRPDGFRDFLLSAFAQAGHDPWVEGGPDPRKAKLGEDCTGDDACRSAICLSAGGRTFCSQDCDGSSGSCPDGYTCRALPGRQACAPPPPVHAGGCTLAAGAPGRGAALCLLLVVALAWSRRRKERSLHASS
jgi:hypothetical protein